MPNVSSFRTVAISVVSLLLIPINTTIVNANICDTQPPLACSPEDRKDKAVAMCAVVMGGCEAVISQLDTTGERLAAGQACNIMVSELSGQKNNIDAMLFSFTVDLVSEGARAAFKSDNILAQVFLGIPLAVTSVAAKAAQLDQCINHAGRSCSQLYDEWHDKCSGANIPEFRVPSENDILNNTISQPSAPFLQSGSSDPELIDLIGKTESMDDEERAYWLDILPEMTTEQRTKLKTILVTERDKLNKLEREYQEALHQLDRDKLPRNNTIDAIATNQEHAISVDSPKVQIGDTYIIESLYPDNPGLNITNERVVTSVGDGKITITSRSIASTTGKARTLQFTSDWNLISSRNADGSGLDYSPPLKYFEFPLLPGKTWAHISTEKNIKTGAVRQHTLSATAGNWENVSVQAGTFQAIKITTKIELLDMTTGQKSVSTDTSWYSPDIRRSVKSEIISNNFQGQQERQQIQMIKYNITDK